MKPYLHFFLAGIFCVNGLYAENLPQAVPLHACAINFKWEALAGAAALAGHVELTNPSPKVTVDRTLLRGPSLDQIHHVIRTIPEGYLGAPTQEHLEQLHHALLNGTLTGEKVREILGDGKSLWKKRGKAGEISAKLKTLTSESTIHVVRRNPFGSPDVKPSEARRMFPVDAEVRIPESLRTAIRSFGFPAEEFYYENFRHAGWGYYGAGKVEFSAHYQTHPNGMRPYFGALVARQLFRMWVSMKEAGTLDLLKPFYVFELAGGLGHLSASILSYTRDRQSNDAAENALWAEFTQQLTVIIAEISPKSVMEAQSHAGIAPWIQQGKIRFENKDALQFLKDIGTGHQGVILSNEFFDNLPSQQVRFTLDGKTLVASFMPVISRETFTGLQAAKVIPASVETLDIPELESVAMPKEAFLHALDRLNRADPELVQRLLRGNIHIVSYYEDVQLYPQIERYLMEHQPEIASMRRTQKTAIDIPVWPLMADYLDQMAKVLSYGFVITLDYTMDIRTLMDPSIKLVRFFYDTLHRIDIRSDWGGYDATINPDRSFLERYGKRQGLETVFEGPEYALEDGATWTMDMPHVIQKFIRNQMVDKSRSSITQSMPKLKQILGPDVSVFQMTMTALSSALFDNPEEFNRLAESITSNLNAPLYQKFALSTVMDLYQVMQVMIMNTMESFYDPGFRLLIQQKIGTGAFVPPALPPARAPGSPSRTLKILA